MILKAYKYRLNPKESQLEILNKHLGCVRFIYNWALSEKIKAYQNKQKLSCFDLSKIVTKLKKEPKTIWLSEVNAQCLQQSINHLDHAFTRFFREKKGFPKFKSKHRKSSFSYPQNIKVNWNNSTVKLPKIGEVRFFNSRQFEGKIKTCTVSKTTRGQYFISILVETIDNIPQKASISEASAIGVDLGITHFATISTGEKIDNPRYLNRSLKKLKYLQRRHSKKKKGSNNRRKHCLRLAKVHEKVRNQRNDFLHKVSTRLIRENQTIILEDLNVSGMLKNHCLARSISDVSWSKFIEYLKYKSEWYGKNLLFIGRFEPSSKMCSCGIVNKNLTLSDRIWTCDSCNAIHDRDILASQNIKRFGLQDQNLVYTGTDCAGELGEVSVC